MDDLKLNTEHRDYLYVYDGSGDPVTGLVQGDFAVTLTVNGSPVTKTITLTEVDSSLRPGLYEVAFTPDELGVWFLHLTHSTYNVVGWAGHYRVMSQLVDDITLENLGPGNRLVTVSVEDVDTGAPVVNAWVVVYDSTLQTRVAFGFTDSYGEILFTLYDGAYEVVLSKIGQYVFSNPNELTVSGDTNVTYTGEEFSPSTPASPDLCVVYGWELDASAAPKGVKVRAEIVASDFFLQTNPHVVKGPIEVTADLDNDGYWEIALTRSDQFAGDETVTYKFTINKARMGDFAIPAQSSVAFKDLMLGS